MFVLVFVSFLLLLFLGGLDRLGREGGMEGEREGVEAVI